MKHLLNRSQNLNTRFLYQEAPSPNDRIEGIAESLRTRAERAELTNEEIQALAGELAERIPADMDISSIINEALGNDPDSNPFDGLIDRVNTIVESQPNASAAERAAERAVATPVREPSNVAIPLTAAEFDEIYENLDTNVNIPASRRATIEAYVIHNLETSADPDDPDNTERLEEEAINQLTETMITNHAIFLQTVEFGETTIDGTPIAQALEEDPEAERVSDVAHRISGEFDHVSPQMLMRAMAGNYEGFGVDENGGATALTEDSIRELAETLNETGEGIDEELQARGLTPGTPPYQQAYNEQMNQAVEQMTLQDVETLGDLIRLFLQHMFPEQYEQEGGPYDANGRPLGTATPRGNEASAESSPESHVENTQLNAEFYGEELLADFRELTPGEQQAVADITESDLWGSGDVLNETDPSRISGWKRAVMRNAVTRNRLGQGAIDARQPFFANDLALQRAIIYIPDQSPIVTTSFAGSGRDGGGGISNVSNSYGSPLGSFYFQPSDVAYLPNHRYRARATVHGMEPMQANYRVQRGEGANIDPSSGNDNSAARAILMHGSTGTTWGCWGIPQANAVVFAQAIQQYGGASGEAFMSTQ